MTYNLDDILIVQWKVKMQINESRAKHAITLNYACVGDWEGACSFINMILVALYNEPLFIADCR